jgi:predicted DNA-binding transcriptional regulator YafY
MTVDSNERRAEIIRILAGRRKETMCNLAFELGVTDRTIRTDITILAVNYPLVTIRGNGGCVKLAEWYWPNKNLLSQEQQQVLSQMIDKGNEQQIKVIREMLNAYGSQRQKETMR